MKVIVGKTAGFCFGVCNAVKNAEKQVKNKKTEYIYCLGELVHNKTVVQKLENMGMKLIDNIENVPAGEKVIIRAHGIPKQIYEQAEKNKIELIDLTCPKVLQVHELAQKCVQQEYYIFVIGEKKHPEVVGTVSYCSNYMYVIENEEDIFLALANLKKSAKTKLAIIAQTTFHLGRFNQYVDKIKDILKDENIQIKVHNTICNSTQARQEETEDVAKKVDCMIIIGGKNSANTKKLCEVASQYCKNTISVEDKNELNLEQIKNCDKIGIMAGASTPKESIEEIENIVKNRRNRWNIS